MTGKPVKHAVAKERYVVATPHRVTADGSDELAILKRIMGMKKILTLIISIAIIAIIIIGLINFDLMVELWVKVLIGVLFAGVLVTVGRALFQGK